MVWPPPIFSFLNWKLSRSSAKNYSEKLKTFRCWHVPHSGTSNLWVLVRFCWMSAFDLLGRVNDEAPGRRPAWVEGWWSQNWRHPGEQGNGQRACLCHQYITWGFWEVWLFQCLYGCCVQPCAEKNWVEAGLLRAMAKLSTEIFISC